MVTATSTTQPAGFPGPLLLCFAEVGGEIFALQSWNELLSCATWQRHILKLFSVFLAAFLTWKLNDHVCPRECFSCGSQSECCMRVSFTQEFKNDLDRLLPRYQECDVSEVSRLISQRAFLLHLSN